jgi:hypothetical protein
MSRQQLIDLPKGLTLAQLETILNDRFRDLNLLLGAFVINPSDVDVSLGGFKITNLADPTDDLDGVNLRTLKRLGAGGATTTATGTATGLDAYTIVFCVPGFLGPNELIPAFVVGLDRHGAPEEVWVYALGAPSTGPFTFQVTKNGANILPAVVTLPNGAVGPIFSIAFSGGSFAHGDVIQLSPVSGSASGISVGVVVRRT